MTNQPKPDYLALILIGAGGAFGRAPTPAEAINIARREAGAFARAFGGFKPGAVLSAGVFDVTGMEDLSVGHDGVFEIGTAKPAPHIRNVNVPAKGKPITMDDYKAGAN